MNEPLEEPMFHATTIEAECAEQSPARPAGGSPAEVKAKQPRSWRPASGGDPGTEAPRQSRLGRRANQQPVRVMAESCRLDKSTLREEDKGEPSPVRLGEGRGSREALGDAAVKNPPGYGERDAGKATRGTREALSKRRACRRKSQPYKRERSGRARRGRRQGRAACNHLSPAGGGPATVKA